MLLNGDKLYMFSSRTPMQCMGFVLSGKGDVIGIDSATRGEAEGIEETVLGMGGRVHCWFLTHAHCDHIEGFVEILRRGKLQVDSVCFAFPPHEYICKAEPNDERTQNASRDLEQVAKEHGVRIIRPQKGVEMQVGHFKVMPLSDGSAVGERLNSSTVVYRVQTSGESVLFLGDMDWVAEDKILQEFPEQIRCPIVQMAHHGQQGVTEKFYRAVRPKVALWCTPEWLWNNDVGTGFNKGPFKTVETRAWMEKLGTVNYRFEKDITVIE